MSTETPDAPTATGTASATFEAWLDDLRAALATADASRVTALLAADCWWRDLLALTWDLGTYRGTEAVAEMLGAHLAAGSVRDLRTDTEFGPRFQGDDDEVVEGFLTFETPLGSGRGAVRLVREDGAWVAWTVM